MPYQKPDGTWGCLTLELRAKYDPLPPEPKLILRTWPQRIGDIIFRRHSASWSEKRDAE